VAAARARGHLRLAHAPTEFNVIGRNVDAATSAVEESVDRAFLAGLTRVRIVHGSGMGIRRKAQRQYLQKHPRVATVAEPQQNAGNAGATVVELRELGIRRISMIASKCSVCADTVIFWRGLKQNLAA
jgi:DNA mismatch repair protein MutS2